MEMQNLFLPATNRFATDYLAQSENIKPFFHYNFKNTLDYKQRLEEISNRSFKRNELASHIESFMSRYPSSPKVKESLEKLKIENSVVVIGGQQAGILSGPLYTIHKVLSIIVLAEKKEKELGVPVIPVFWIAGEDHDYQEVNHIFVDHNKKVEKWVYPEKVREKKMVSNIAIDKEICLSWTESIIETFGETNHTKKLVQFVTDAIENSNTFVDFFAYIIMSLFKDYGLLIVDSGNHDLRMLEKEYFIQLIERADQITKLVKEQQAKLNQLGFSQAIEISDLASNIFYYDEELQERILLEFDQKSLTFKGKNGLYQFTVEEMLRMAAESPESLSNNVVTRPIMQDLLFPTLAFIAGPGEIAYWAELKKAFELLNLKMPPIVPRLNITILERTIEAEISQMELSIEEVLNDGVTKSRKLFLDSIKNKELELIFNRTREQLLRNYEEIEEVTKALDQGLLPLLKKNEKLLLEQLRFMENKLEYSIQMKHEIQLNKFLAVEHSLKPLGSPQERIWNIFYYLNKFGFQFVIELLKLPYEFDGAHNVVKI